MVVLAARRIVLNMKDAVFRCVGLLSALACLHCAGNGASSSPDGSDTPSGQPGDGNGDGSDSSSGEGDGGNAGSDGPMTPNVNQDVDGPPNADHPYIQYFGRWDRSDPLKAVARWGSVYIKARFEGTGCTLRLTDEQVTVPGGFGTGNIYQYQIDGGDFIQLPSTAATEYVLATDLSAGPHEVTVVRLTESKFGTTSFFGFTFEGDGALIEPLPRPTRSIEVFGDSISAGLANVNGGDYRNVNQNGYEAFGPELARLLDAEWSVEARGGGSLLSATWLPMIPWFDKTFGPLDLQHLPNEDAKLWDFSVYEPDVFVLALGTNDSSEMYPALSESSYVAKYQGFVATIREKYPSTVIFALAPFKEGEPWDLVRAHIQKAVDTFEDDQLHAVIPLEGTFPNYSGHWLQYPADYVSGDEYHPNLDGNDKIAVKLRDIVQTKMNWD